eukprot:2130402-Amphidinium_carterae.1
MPFVPNWLVPNVHPHSPLEWDFVWAQGHKIQGQRKLGTHHFAKCTIASPISLEFLEIGTQKAFKVAFELEIQPTCVKVMCFTRGQIVSCVKDKDQHVKLTLALSGGSFRIENMLWRIMEYERKGLFFVTGKERMSSVMLQAKQHGQR